MGVVLNLLESAYCALPQSCVSKRGNTAAITEYVYVEGGKYVQTRQIKYGLEVAHVCTNVKTASIFQRRGERRFRQAYTHASLLLLTLISITL